MKKIIVDVRDNQEYETKHLSGAISIPLTELGDRYSELEKDAQIQIVCNFGGQRSQKAAELLKQKGFENVEILEGGMSSIKD